MNMITIRTRMAWIYILCLIHFQMNVNEFRVIPSKLSVDNESSVWISLVVSVILWLLELCRFFFKLLLLLLLALMDSLLLHFLPIYEFSNLKNKMNGRLTMCMFMHIKKIFYLKMFWFSCVNILLYYQVVKSVRCHIWHHTDLSMCISRIY